MKHTIQEAVWLTIVVGLALACSSSHKELAYNPSFAYAPPANEAPSDVSIALISAKENNLQPALGNVPWTVGNKHKNAFLASVTNGLQQLISARGFKISGPFAQMDDMTFPQKKQSELALIAVSNITAESRCGGSGEHQLCFGECALSGFLSFEMWEPMSGQKVFMKRVDVPRTAMPCDGKPSIAENRMAQLLEKAFATVMDKANQYFVKEEIELARRQSKELREKKVY